MNKEDTVRYKKPRAEYYQLVLCSNCGYELRLPYKPGEYPLCRIYYWTCPECLKRSIKH